jgi:hypothetical protein
VAILALNSKSEAIGTYTARIKTTPKAKAPVLTKPPDRSDALGSAIVPLQLVATETPITSWAASGQPPNVSFNTATGQFTGSPTGSPSTYTVKATATNAQGTSETVEWKWTITAAPTLQTGLVLNSDETSSQTLAGVALATKKPMVIRDYDAIGNSAASVAAKAKLWQEKGHILQPLAGFQARNPTEAEAKGLKAWAEACNAYGVQYIEFGNETNYQITNNQANGEVYGKRVKEACEALVASGTSIKLLVQGSDAGAGQHTWLDGIYVAFPTITSHAAFGGWTIHAYPNSHVETEKDTFGIPMMERMVSALAGHGDTTSKFFDTEWGAPSTSAGTTMTSGQSLDWGEAAGLLTKHQKLLETASGKRLIQLLLYQAHDQGPEGETNREKYFGALTSSAGRKGTFSSFAESFL